MAREVRCYRLHVTATACNKKRFTMVAPQKAYLARSRGKRDLVRHLRLRPIKPELEDYGVICMNEY